MGRTLLGLVIDSDQGRGMPTPISPSGDLQSSLGNMIAVMLGVLLVFFLFKIGQTLVKDK